MKRSGPDSITSWLIAGACCFINMMLFGMARLSGVLFVASTSRFQVSRQQASLPYTFGTFMRNASGPLVGYLGHKFGVRKITTFGCILGAIGAGSCYFAEDITTVTILWGVVFGYFRDDIGSYDYIFYIIGIISAVCCLGLLLVPWIARCRQHR